MFKWQIQLYLSIEIVTHVVSIWKCIVIFHNISHLVGLDYKCFIMVANCIMTNNFIQFLTTTENNIHSKKIDHFEVWFLFTKSSWEVWFLQHTFYSYSMLKHTPLISYHKGYSDCCVRNTKNTRIKKRATYKLDKVWASVWRLLSQLQVYFKSFKVNSCL